MNILKRYSKADLSYFLGKTIEYAAYLYLFCLPFGKSIVEIASVIIIISFFLKCAIKRNVSLPPAKVNFPLFIFIAALFLSLINTPDLFHSVKAIISKYLKFIVVFWAISETFDTERKIKNMVKVAVLSSILICADGFIQYFLKYDILHLPPYPIFKNRITACFPYPNDFASWILIFILPALSVFAFCKSRPALRLWGGFVFFIQALALYLTETRSALLGIIIGIVFICVLKRLYKVFLGFVVLTALLASLFLAKPDIFPANMSSMDGIRDRKVMWTNAVTIIRRHPIIGNGVNTFFNNYKNVRNDEYRGGKGSYAHNCFLQMAAEIGIVGLFAYLLFLGAFFKETISAFKGRGFSPCQVALLMGLLAGIATFLVNAFFDTSLYSLNLNALFWITLSFTLAASRVRCLS